MSEAYELTSLRCSRETSDVGRNETKRRDSQAKKILDKMPVGCRLMFVAESLPAMFFFTHLDLISIHSLCSWQNKFQFHASELASVTVYLISACMLIQSKNKYNFISFPFGL